MSESLSPNTIIKERLSRLPRWLLIGLAGIGCIILVIVAQSFVKVRMGGYAVEDVILSKGLRDNQPIGIGEVFNPSDTIICTVKTRGIDGIAIGMRWYSGDNLIYEHTGKTQNNTVSTYIESNKDVILPEGKYHVDVSIHDEVFRTVYFQIKTYHPSVIPPITVPNGHTAIELPWYPEAPFAFDETWTIDGTKWQVNEVKVVLMGDTQDYFVCVVIDTDRNDLVSLSEDEAKGITRPIAIYALKNGYIERARNLRLDGKYYDLDRYVFVSLKNPASQYAYRVMFTMDLDFEQTGINSHEGERERKR